MNKKGFTLIELLAVIIILGILMIIAIPSVTRYISDSRKNAYVDTAKEIVGGARNLVNEGKLEMYDTDVTYYIESSCIKTENALKSPYGDFTKAYVVVTYDGKGYTYYWTSNDDSGQGIKEIVRVDKLDVDNIESDLKDSEISTLRGIDGRKKTVVVSKANGCFKEGANTAKTQINGETGEENSPVVYPDGKNKDNLEIGDIVKIGNEEFHYIGKSGEYYKLFARYNLKVGEKISSGWQVIYNYSSADEGYGLQSSDMLGFIERHAPYNGTTAFSTTNYWNNNVGTGKKYPGSYSGPNYPYVYDPTDEHCIVATYVENYKDYLIGLGADIKEARLISYAEYTGLGCQISGWNPQAWSCASAPFLKTTDYWFGDAKSSTYVLNMLSDTYSYTTHDVYGVRPLIVIDL